MTTPTSDELERLTEAIQRATGAYTSETEEMRARREQEEASVAKSKAVSDAGAKAGMAAVAALGSFSKSLLSTDAGMSKYNSTLSGAGNAALDIGKNFGIAGVAIGGFVKLLTLGAELVLKQNDAMIKAYDTLGELGTASGLTTRGILELGTKAGYSSHNLEIFTKHVGSLGTDLLALGVTTARGVEAFSKLAAVTQDQRNQYNRLGISQEELTKRQSDYVRTTVGAGISIAKSPELLKQQSLKYIDVLNELAAITGISRDKAQEALDAANNNLNYQTHMYELGVKEKKLREEALVAEQNGNKELRDAKIKEADSTHAVIENTQRAAVVISKFADANQQAGILAKLTGGAWTEISAKLTRTMPGLDDLGTRLKRGEDISADLLEISANGTRDMLDNFGGVFKLGEAGTAAAEALGVSSKNIKFLAEWDSKTVEERKEALKSMQEEMKKKKEGIGLFDDVKNAQNSQLALELQLRQSMDGVVSVMSGPFTSVFDTLTQVLSGFAKGIAKFTKLIGGPDLTGIFETAEELSSKLKNTGDEIANVTSGIKGASEVMKTNDPAIIAAFAKKENKDAGDAYATTIGARKSLEKERDASTDPANKAKLSDEIDKIKDKEERQRQRVTETLALQRSLSISMTTTGKKEEVDKYIQQLLEKKSVLLKDEVDLKKRASEKTVHTVQQTVDNDPAVKKAAEKLKFTKLANDKSRQTLEEDSIAELIESEKTRGDQRRFSDLASYNAYKADLKANNELQKTNDLERDQKVITDRITKEQAEKLAAAEKAARDAKLKFEDNQLAEFKKKNKDFDAKPHQGSAPTPVAAAAATTATSISAASPAIGNKTALSSNISKYESGAAGYNAYNKGTDGNKIVASDKEIDFSNMTIDEFLRRGKLKKGDPDKIFAMGKYQIIPDTMEGIVKKLGIDKSTKLDAATQDLLFTEGLMKNKRPAVESFVTGKSNDLNGAVLALAQEFASVGVPFPAGKATKRGESYYGGANKAHNPPEQVEQALLSDREKNKSETTNTLPQARDGGLFAGPSTGFPVELHGNELVAPLDPTSIIAKLLMAPGAESMPKLEAAMAPPPSAAQDNSGGLTVEMVAMLSDKLDAMISKLSDGNDTQEQLLRYSRA